VLGGPGLFLRLNWFGKRLPKEDSAYLSEVRRPCCCVIAKALTSGWSSTIRRPRDGIAVQIILKCIINLGNVRYDFFGIRDDILVPNIAIHNIPCV